MFGNRRAKQTEEVYKKYYPILRLRCFKFFRREEDVEDVMQNVFFTIYKQIDSYRGERERILPWLYRITTTHCLKFIEKNNRWKRDLDTAFTEGKERFQGSVFDDSLDVRLSLGTLVEKLPPKQRECVVFHYISGMSQREIAEVMEVTRDQVRTWLTNFSKRAESWQKEFS